MDCIQSTYIIIREYFNKIILENEEIGPGLYILIMQELKETEAGGPPIGAQPEQLSHVGDILSQNQNSEKG